MYAGASGRKKITVLNQEFNTRNMRESCKGGPRGDAVIRNDYWVQKSTGLLRKSRQWIGPRVGYFELILVKNYATMQQSAKARLYFMGRGFYNVVKKI